jgi:Uma2 family endonuclease
MAIQEKLYTVDDLWAMERDPAFEGCCFYLIDGKLYEDKMPGRRHGLVAVEIAFHFRQYTAERPVGEVTIEVGFHPADSRYTALLPNVACQRYTKLPDPAPEGYVPQMPDLALSRFNRQAIH